MDGNASVRRWGNHCISNRALLLLVAAERPIAPTGDWLRLMPCDRYQYAIRWTKPGGNKRECVAYVWGVLRVLRQSRIPAAGLLKPAPAAYYPAEPRRGPATESREKPMELGLTGSNLLDARYRDYMNFFRLYADEPGINVSLQTRELIHSLNHVKFHH
jgi:iron complex outermembrane receptor protein